VAISDVVVKDNSFVGPAVPTSQQRFGSIRVSLQFFIRRKRQTSSAGANEPTLQLGQVIDHFGLVSLFPNKSTVTATPTIMFQCLNCRKVKHMTGLQVQLPHRGVKQGVGVARIIIGHVVSVEGGSNERLSDRSLVLPMETMFSCTHSLVAAVALLVSISVAIPIQ